MPHQPNSAQFHGHSISSTLFQNDHISHPVKRFKSSLKNKQIKKQIKINQSWTLFLFVCFVFTGLEGQLRVYVYKMIKKKIQQTTWPECLYGGPVLSWSIWHTRPSISLKELPLPSLPPLPNAVAGSSSRVEHVTHVQPIGALYLPTPCPSGPQGAREPSRAHETRFQGMERLRKWAKRLEMLSISHIDPTRKRAKQEWSQQRKTQLNGGRGRTLTLSFEPLACAMLEAYLSVIWATKAPFVSQFESCSPCF